MNNCRSCRFWGDGFRPASDAVTSSCGRIDAWSDRNADPSTLATIDVSVHDDSGLDVRLMTGANFGCTNHAPIVVPPTSQP